MPYLLKFFVVPWKVHNGEGLHTGTLFPTPIFNPCLHETTRHRRQRYVTRHDFERNILNSDNNVAAVIRQTRNM